MTVVRSRVRRRIGFTVAGLAVGLAVAIALRPEPVRVDVASVSRGRFEVTVDEEGQTRIRDRFVVTAPASGRVARITLDAGDPVEQGAVVARMRPLPLDPRGRAEAEARLAAALATESEAAARVERARAAAAQAVRTAARARALGGTGVIGTEARELAELDEIARGKELDAALFAARTAAHNVEAARAALLAPGDDAGEDLAAACEMRPASCLELRSPVRGKVLRLPEQSERVVAAGTALLELGDPAELEIVIDVLSADAVKVKPGALVRIEEWGGDTPLEARVRVVEPSGFTKVSALGVEEQRVNVVADFTGDHADLADGFRVEARIVVWQGDDVLQVPASALFRRAGAWHVFVVEDGRARRRAIEVGQRSATGAQVVRGVADAETVILHPSDQIEDGTRIEPL